MPAKNFASLWFTCHTEKAREIFTQGLQQSGESLIKQCRGFGRTVFFLLRLRAILRTVFLSLAQPEMNDEWSCLLIALMPMFSPSPLFPINVGAKSAKSSLEALFIIHSQRPPSLQEGESRKLLGGY